MSGGVGPRPPRGFEILLRLFGPRADQEYLAGDLAEGYRQRAGTNVRRARRWYRGQVLAAIGRAPVWRGLWLDATLQALRHGLRGVRSQPALALVAIVSLALGIGASTAIFSVTDRLLLRRLPVEKPENLFQVVNSDNSAGVVTNPIWEAFRDRQDFLPGSFAFADTSFEVVRDGQVERLLGAWVSGGFLPTLGIGVAAGRPITPADDYRGCPAIALLGHGYWLREYGGSPGVIGETIVLEDQPVEVVGVAHPDLRGLTTGLGTQVFLPLCAEAVLRRGSMLDAHHVWSLRMIVRRPEQMSAARLDAQIDAIAPGIFEATVPPDWEGERRTNYLTTSFDVRSVSRGLTRVSARHERPLWILTALGALVVLAACANLATLLLARGEARQREVAIQAAIGADRWRIFGQSLAESFLLAAIGSMLGLVLAVWSSRALVSLMSTRWEEISIDLSLDTRVLGYTIAVTTLTVILFGLGPALRTTRVDGSRALLALGRSGSGSRLRAARLSVVLQVAMSVVLVAAAGLLGGTLWQLETLDAGFRRQDLLVVEVDAERAVLERESLAATARATLDRLRDHPSIRGATVANMTPISGSSQTMPVVAGNGAPGDPVQEVWVNTVGEGYFDTFGTRLIEGRDFAAHDHPGAPPVAIVNEALARGLFGTVDVVGRTIRHQLSPDGSELSEPFRIVGLVQDAKYRSLREPEPPTLYHAYFQRERFYPWFTFPLHVDRTGVDDGEGLPPSVAAIFEAIGPDVRLRVDTLDARIGDSLKQERMLAVLSALFGVAALFLCAIGLHGVVSYGVARRTHELSVRTALGATRGSVLRLVMTDAGRLVGAGTLLGVAASLLGRRLLDAFAYGISPTDPRPLAVAVALLLAIAWLSCLRPARRAAASDPIDALRAD